MKRFIFSISLYPQEFKTEGETEKEAREKAEQLFFSKNNGTSIYECLTMRSEDF